MILVVSYREGLCKALEERGLPYYLWTDKPVKHTIKALKHFIGPLEKLPKLPKGITHVIAGSEASVVPAGKARIATKSRRLPMTVVERCHDKLVMKRCLQAHGIVLTPFLTYREIKAGADPAQVLGLPLVVKERSLSGGRGTEFVKDPQLVPALLKPTSLVERHIVGSEASVESFVSDGKILFTNITQYYKRSSVNILPAPFSQAEQQILLELNARIIRLLKIPRGMTHLEIYRTAQGPVFGEIALRPPGGYLMELMEIAYGFNPWHAYIAMELGEDFAFPNHAKQTTGAVIFHPGAGMIRSISGLEKMRGDPAVRKVRFNRRSGDAVSSRLSVAENIGYLLIAHRDPAIVVKTVDRALAEIQIELEPA